MRAVLALVVCVALAEAGALVWLSGRQPPAPLTAEGSALPTVVTHTIYATSGDPTATPTTPTDPAPPPADPLQRIAELEETVRQQNKAIDSIAPRLREKTREVERLRVELAHLRKNSGLSAELPPDPAPGVPDAELTEEQLRDRLKRLALEAVSTAWTAGYTIPDGVIPGATEADRVSAESLIADEEPRMLAALRSFIRSEKGDQVPPDLDSMPAHQLVQRHVGPLLSEGWNKLGQIPLIQHAELMRGDRGLEDVLGADHTSSRLARICANVRRETWGQLERALAPDQVRLIKDRHLRLGYYKYGGWQLHIGPTNSY